MSQIVRIATRESPLALWQAEFVKAELLKHHPGLEVQLLGFTTQGDKILDSPLAKIGGKGLFVKELETAMLEHKADIAVHSMKDVPVDFPAGLMLATICEREDPADAFVSHKFASIDELPHGAIVGTSSLRRRCQLLQARPDLDIRDLRGNVNTRLRKLDEGQYDAIVLAVAGLKRLKMEARIRSALPMALSLPAVGQGAVGIECRRDDHRMQQLLAPLHHAPTAARVMAERAMNARLQGGCQVPIAGFAVLDQGILQLQGRVGSPDGRQMLKAQASAPLADAESLGRQVADDLLAQGAAAILAAVYAS